MNPSDYPDSPLGTVRVSPTGGTIAIRGFSGHGDPVWWFVDTGDSLSGPPDISDWATVRSPA